MDEPILRAKEVHERAKVDDFDHRSFIDLANFRIVGDGFDPVDRSSDRIGVGRGDLYRAVVLDIDLRAGLLDDLSDDFAAGADHFADLVGWDLQSFNSRRELAELRPGAGQ